MGIIEVRKEWFRNECIGTIFVFEDDKSVSVDENNNVYDCDGFATIPKARIKTIEHKINSKIIS